MYNELIYLASYRSTINNVGDQIESMKKEARLAKLKSIGQAEFYQAHSQGLKPELKFVLPDYMDYNGQEYVIYNDFRYKVLRTFRTGNEIEIVCYGGVRLEVVSDASS